VSIDAVTYAFIAVGDLSFVTGLALNILVWIRYRQPYAPWGAVFICPLFLGSPAYFRPEGQPLRRLADGAFGIAVACLIALWEGFKPQ
jgi:hypothetical protein